MTNFNHMVPYKRNSFSTKDNYFRKCLSQDEKNFDPKKINILDQPVVL